MSASTTPCPPPWWTDCGEISRLLRWLEDNGGLDVADCISIVEKPWHWEDEYREMCDEKSGNDVRATGFDEMAVEAANDEIITDCDDE